MKLSLSVSKKRQVALWVQMFRRSDAPVNVSNYSYKCFFSGKQVTKTLIVFPDEVETTGIITIDKPLEKVELSDIIKLTKRLAFE